MQEKERGGRRGWTEERLSGEGVNYMQVGDEKRGRV